MRVHRVLATVLVAGLALTACGGSDEPKSNGVADKSAQQIVDASKAAMKDVGSVHLKGSVKVDGEDMTVDAKVRTAAKEGTGTLTVKGSKVELIRKGDQIYFKAPTPFYTDLGVPAQLATLMGGRWLVAPATGQFADLATFFDVDDMLKPEGSIEKGSQTKVNGESVIEVKDTSADSPGSLYVRTTGKPLVEQIKSTGEGSGTIDFSEYGETVTVEAPKDAVDLSKLTG